MVDLLPKASLFTRMVTDISTDCWQRIDLSNQFKCFFKLSFGDKSHIPSGVLMNRTGFLTGGKRNLLFRFPFS
jgi:hypothetical protein